MVSFGPDASCRDAELYYYQYLCDPHEASIPSGIAHHIQQCPCCQSQIDQLKATLDDVGPCRQTSGMETGIVEALTLHFAHIGEDVGCAQAKSFLPALLIPSLKIRIPTPITVHVDGCPQCREDMQALGELGLTNEQLARLSRLYAEGAADNPALCRRIRPKIHADGPAWFEDADPQVRDHVCACPRCRTRVYRRRERTRPGGQGPDIDPGPIACSDISTADLFDWIVPYGLPDGPRPMTVAQEAIHAHLQACPDCAERMQQLHRMVYGIAERADSGVTTVYTTADQRPAVYGRVGSMDAGYPVQVNVTHREPAPTARRLASIVRLPAAVWSRVTHRQFRPALAAAAVVLVDSNRYKSCGLPAPRDWFSLRTPQNNVASISTTDRKQSVICGKAPSRAVRSNRETVKASNAWWMPHSVSCSRASRPTENFSARCLRSKGTPSRPAKSMN
jgi:hypothetical protein